MALPCFPASVVREPTAKRGYRRAFFDVEWVRERISWTSRRSVFGLRFSAAAVFLGGSFHFDQGGPPCQFMFLSLRREINSA